MSDARLLPLPDVGIARFCFLIAVAAGCAAPSTSGRSPAPGTAPFDLILRGGSVLADRGFGGG
jgi:hypothetical protein